MEQKKNYNLATFDDVDGGRDPKELYLVDVKRKKILLFLMYSDCKDVTRQTQRMYDTDMGKGGHNRRIGCDLIDFMNGRDRHPWLKIILSTDDAREVTRKVAGIRARWFNIHSEVLQSTADMESAGWGRHNDPTKDDNFVAEHFTDL